MANEATAATPDTCVVCGAPLSQVDGGHRRRHYCNNNNACKQAAHRLRQDKKREQEVRERWSGFAPDTQNYLEWLMNKYGHDFANGFAHIIKREQELVTPEPVLTLEEARQRAHWNNYTNPTSYLESTGRLFLSLLQKAGAETARQVAEAINHERGNERPLIAELEQTIEAQTVRITALEQELTNEKTASSAGEKMLELQHRELGAQFMRVGRDVSYRMLPLSQFIVVDPDLYDIKAGKAHWEEASYSLSPYDLALAIVYAKQVLLTDTLLKDQQSIASDHTWRMKQELDRYRQVADMSNRERLEQQFMAIGSQIAYKWLLCGVSDGVDSWMSYMTKASDEQLAKAVTMAQFYGDNLIGLEQKEQLRKAHRRIQELERAASQQSLKTVS